MKKMVKKTEINQIIVKFVQVKIAKLQDYDEKRSNTNTEILLRTLLMKIMLGTIDKT